MSKSFKEVTEVGDNLMVVDLLNLCFRWRHTKTPDYAKDCLRTIESLKRSYKAKYVVIACDKGSSTYRKEIYPEYKQNRKEQYKDQTEEEAEEFRIFFEDFEKTVTLLEQETDYPVLRFQGVEADDIAAYITSVIEEYPKVEHTWLVSSDKDWDLLVSESVSRFSYVTRKETTYENWGDHHEYPQDDYISIKCLTGDSGDNVMGVPGIGPKRACQLVTQYGTAIDIVANLPIDSKYKYIQELNKCGDLIMLNYQLMDLVTFCRDAIGSDNIKEIDSILKDYLSA